MLACISAQIRSHGTPCKNSTSFFKREWLKRLDSGCCVVRMDGSRVRILLVLWKFVPVVLCGGLLVVVLRDVIWCR